MWGKKQIWYRLKNNDESIDMLFTRFIDLKEYLRYIPRDKALDCHWELYKKDIE